MTHPRSVHDPTSDADTDMVDERSDRRVATLTVPDRVGDRGGYDDRRCARGPDPGRTRVTDVVDVPHASIAQAMTKAIGADDHRLERRNWWLHVLEAGMGIGFMGAINNNTVGTALVERLGGAPWMVALVPMLMIIGFSLGPLLNAHHLERKARFLPVLMRTMPWSRLSLPIIALALWLSGDGAWSLWIVLIGYLSFGLIGGLGTGAWQQMVAKTVPPAKRPGLLASRYLLANLIGVGAGALVTLILSLRPGLDGYALLHLIAFGGWMIAYALLSRIREPHIAAPPVPPGHGLWRNLRTVPELIAADRRLCWFLVSSALVSSQFLLVGFLALHARRVLDAPESYVGTLTTAQMVGAVAGMLFAAWRGNHHGSHALLIVARALFVATAVGALVASSDWAFRLVFAAYGAAFWLNLVGHNAMALELMPVARRATVLAVFGAVGVPSMIIAAQLGAVLWHSGVPFAWIAALSVLGLVAALLTMLPVRSCAR